MKSNEKPTTGYLLVHTTPRTLETSGKDASIAPENY